MSTRKSDTDQSAEWMAQLLWTIKRHVVLTESKRDTAGTHPGSLYAQTDDSDHAGAYPGSLY